MHALVYRCDACWQELRIIGRIEHLHCPCCRDELVTAPQGRAS